MNTVWLVIDGKHNPGRVIAVMANEEDVDLFLNELDEETYAEERTVIYGQPSSRRFNP